MGKRIEITEENFVQPRAGKIILDLVKKGATIPKNCQYKIFDLLNTAEIMLEFVKRDSLLTD